MAIEAWSGFSIHLHPFLSCLFWALSVDSFSHGTPAPAILLLPHMKFIGLYGRLFEQKHQHLKDPGDVFLSFYRALEPFSMHGVERSNNFL